MPANIEPDRQIDSAVSAIRDCLGETVLAVYLGGSSGAGKLRPQSDIDLLVIVDRSLTDDRRKALLEALLRLSGRHPAKPNGPRCLDVSVFCQPDLDGSPYPAQSDFTYGEWLRENFEAGERPLPVRDSENTLILEQVRRKAQPLFGPDAALLLPEIPPEQIRQSMRDALPALLGSLHGDERNVLLTLARMWCTARTGAFVTKDEAADWAIPHIDDHNAATLDYARKAYLGQCSDDWGNQRDEAQRLADVLAAKAIELL